MGMAAKEHKDHEEKDLRDKHQSGLAHSVSEATTEPDSLILCSVRSFAAIHSRFSDDSISPNSRIMICLRPQRP